MQPENNPQPTPSYTPDPAQQNSYPNYSPQSPQTPNQPAQAAMPQQAPVMEQPQVNNGFPTPQPVQGYPGSPQPQPHQQMQPMHAVHNPTEGNKSFIGTFLLSWLLGQFGADRFYVGKTATAIIKLVTFGGLGIWAVIDIILIGFGKFKDKQNNQLQGYSANKDWAKIAAIIIAIVNGLVLLVLIPFFIFLPLFTLTGIQEKARDSERQTDINALHSGLEAYYATNLKYPTLTEMNDAAFREKNMPVVVPGSYQDPMGSDDKLQDSTNAYIYSPTDNNNFPCDNVSKKCDKYTLQARLEGGGVYIKQNLEPTQ